MSCKYLYFFPKIKIKKKMEWLKAAGQEMPGRHGDF